MNVLIRIAPLIGFGLGLAACAAADKQTTVESSFAAQSPPAAAAEAARAPAREPTTRRRPPQPRATTSAPAPAPRPRNLNPYGIEIRRVEDNPDSTVVVTWPEMRQPASYAISGRVTDIRQIDLPGRQRPILVVRSQATGFTWTVSLFDPAEDEAAGRPFAPVASEKSDEVPDDAVVSKGAIEVGYYAVDNREAARWQQTFTRRTLRWPSGAAPAAAEPPPPAETSPVPNR